MTIDGGFDQPGDPIHSQSIYLTPRMLDTLATKYAIHPFTILQHPGEAVFIPAGCAHQVSHHLHLLAVSWIDLTWKVSNESDAIKIACDYISIENIDKT